MFFPLRHLMVPGPRIYRIYIHQRGLIHITRLYVPWYAIVVKYQRNVNAKHTSVLRVKDLSLNERE